ncbi:MAG TPA: BON domain-containing protein [Deltaproteobacteria bacterium]|jgi:osmotically-inducible protein OsmY|nr:BON domain-containing protein [Deltaproteobacteria bacterium]HQI00207.1 BON domain-containing protein [Deltaproteobacteria bacterium]
MVRRRAEEVRADVLSQMFRDDSLDPSGINVDVADSRVILTGTVPSYSDKWEAQNDAYDVPGVRYVENRLRVVPIVTPSLSDADIRARVEKVLNWSSVIDASRINVSVDNGIVTLSGIVDSYWQKGKAWDLASNVIGVVDVINDLVVSPPESIADEVIRDEILSAFDRLWMDTSHVNVSVRDCIVTLSGTVDTYNDFRSVDHIARNTAGVCEVRNDIVIE